MSYSYMRQLADEAATKARKSKREPKTFVGLGEDAIRSEIRHVPFLGSYTPKGWTRVDVEGPRRMGCEEGYLFVDSSGVGGTSEPALSVGEFVDFIYANKEYGFGIAEAGQFQVVIACYERKAK